MLSLYITFFVMDRFLMVLIVMHLVWACLHSYDMF